MAGPYRESDTAAIDCPRCGRTMPPGAIAACGWGCGVWVNADVAGEALLPAERTTSRLTTWFRERAMCPHCATLMTLRGLDMALFQGCDEHGFWLDDETVGQSGLARPTFAPQVQRAREAAKAHRIERERREAEERAAREAREQAEREAEARAKAEDRSGWDTVEKRMRAAAEAERRRAEERAWKLAPYVNLLRQLAQKGDVTALAEHLMKLDETIEELRRRIDDLERSRV